MSCSLLNQRCFRLFGLWGMSLFSTVFFGCQQEEPYILLGKDYNPTYQRVVDTASSFHLNDPLRAHFYYGKPLECDTLEMTIRRQNASGVSEPVITRQLPVDSRSNNVVVGGSRRKPMNARRFTHSEQEGLYVVAFYCRDTLLASRSFEMYRGKKMEKNP